MKRTPLYDIHKELRARLVDFAGWEMPVLYSSIIEEHRAVRQRVGLFDVSHMGQVEIRGGGALSLLQRVTCNDASRLKPGQSQYAAFLTPAGTFIDDIIVSCRGPDFYFICVNASNTDKDFKWVAEEAKDKVSVVNKSDDYALLALQGPQSVPIMEKLSSTPLPPKPFTCSDSSLKGIPVFLSRTGYTGEEGFEIYSSPSAAADLWNLLMETGGSHEILPCGLGARDTLRLEAAYSLYGHEISDQINPFEAGLEWIVKLQKGDFIGREALVAVSRHAPDKKLVGITVENGIARQGHKLFSGAEEIGFVTSGTHSPSLDRPIALGYVKNNFTKVGTKIEVDIRGKKREAMIVLLPFYKRT